MDANLEEIGKLDYCIGMFGFEDGVDILTSAYFYNICAVMQLANIMKLLSTGGAR